MADLERPKIKVGFIPPPGADPKLPPRRGFGPVMEGFDHVPFDDLEATKAAVTRETGAGAGAWIGDG